MRLIGAFFIGLVVGVLGNYGYLNYNVKMAFFDMNMDGVPDVQYVYRYNSTLKQMRIDRNHDGIEDSVVEYDRFSIPIYEHGDDNFDGIYDTDIGYKWGLISKVKIDTDQDGKHEVNISYRKGVLDSIIYLDGSGVEESRDDLVRLKFK